MGIPHTPGKTTTAGRCHACKVLYQWPAGRKRRLYDARCAYCGGRLSQTAVALIKHKRWAGVLPSFGGGNVER